MHPYEKADETDLYYTELANEIYHALDEACYTHNFKNMDEAKQLALSIAGYFEDVISGTGIWKTFTEECKQRYYTYIPFYEKESEFIKSTLNEDDPAYDPEEINIADVKFLLLRPLPAEQFRTGSRSFPLQAWNWLPNLPTTFSTENMKRLSGKRASSDLSQRNA